MDAPAPSHALNRHLAFTQRALDTLKPHARGLVEYYDTKMPGLALRVQPTGKKTFYLNYRLPNQRKSARCRDTRLVRTRLGGGHSAAACLYRRVVTDRTHLGPGPAIVCRRSR